MSTSRQTALITGASSGIGAELAQLFAHDNYRIILVARSHARLTELATALERQYQVPTMVIASDLASPTAVDDIMRTLEQAAVPVDVLVNNAGAGQFGPFATSDPDVAQRMLQLNIMSLTQLTRRCLEPMLARDAGKILNVASTAAFQPGPFMALYYASKAYVLSFSDALAEEVRGSGVSVTTLCPGPTQTNFQQQAHMEGVRLFQRPDIMRADRVARAGYRGLMRKRVLVVPGLLNTLIIFGVRCAPRALVARCIRLLHTRRN